MKSQRIVSIRGGWDIFQLFWSSAFLACLNSADCRCTFYHFYWVRWPIFEASRRFRYRRNCKASSWGSYCSKLFLNCLQTTIAGLVRQLVVSTNHQEGRVFRKDATVRLSLDFSRGNLALGNSGPSQINRASKIGWARWEACSLTYASRAELWLRCCASSLRGA